MISKIRYLSHKLIAGLALLLASAASAAGATGVTVPTPVFQKLGDFALFPGNQLTATTSPNFSNTFTAMLWIDPLAVSGGWTNLLSFGSPFGDWGLYFQPGTTNLHFTYLDPANQYRALDVYAPLALNTWTNVAIESTAGGEIKVLFNGAFVPQSAAPASGALPGLIYASSPMFQPANAKLGDLEIWNSVLTQAQIVTVMNTRSVSPVPEPETYALMLAGLGLLVITFSRRRR